MDISTKALLMSLTVKAPTGNRKDKKATDRTLADNDAAAGAGVFSKKLYGDALKPYLQVRNRIKDWFYSNTLPWAENGLRILPTAKLFEAKKDLSRMEVELSVETQKILDRYSQIREEAEYRLGRLFSEDDYPSLSKLAEKFGMEVAYYPIPTAGDFRVSLSDEATEELRRQMEDSVNMTMQNGIRDLWERLHERVSKLAEILDREEGKVRDDFLKRTIDLCSSLKDLNLWGDQNLANMANAVESRLTGLSEAGLMQDRREKAGLAHDVDRIMADMSGFMGFISAPKPAPRPEPAPAPYGWAEIEAGLEEEEPVSSPIVSPEPQPEPEPERRVMHIGANGVYWS